MTKLPLGAVRIAAPSGATEAWLNYVPTLETILWDKIEITKGKLMTTWTHLIKIEQEGDDAYIAESILLPSAFVFGETPDEARNKLAQDIQDFYEVLMTGEPKGDFRVVDVELPKYSSTPLRFVAYLMPEKSGGYSVGCPFFDNAVTQGDTEAEALDMIKDLIELHVEWSASDPPSDAISYEVATASLN